MSRHPRLRLVLAMVAALSPAAVAHAEPSVSLLPLPFAVTAFRGPDSRVAQTAGSTEAYRSARLPAGQPPVVLWGREGGAIVILAGQELKVVSAGRRGGGDLSRLEAGRDSIPAGRAEALGPFTATLIEPTRDYPHEALGSPVHARALAVAERKPAAPGPEPKPVPVEVTRVPAGPDAVFEDREPRFVDLGRDGPAIAVIRSYRDRGSALALVGRRDGGWRVVAETPADGEPNRWLNPAGFPSLGGTRLILVVRRPHLDGVLQLWRVGGDRLDLVAERAGYSNHAYGEAAQGLAALFGTGPALRLAIPTLDRAAIALVAVKADGLAETARVPLPARVTTGVAVMGEGASTHVLAGLEDGRVAVIRP